jgi:type I restriction enzyme S subunit
MPANNKQKLGDLFRNRRERGLPGLPVVSVTLNDGLVGRDTLDRKTDTNLAPEEHLLIKAGDIAYNMMRMWQGASGLAQHDGIVSPAYVVLAPKNGIDPLFASYWFKSPRMIYLFWAYSYGLTNDRLRLYFKDFAEIPVSLPTLDEQVRIGKILSLWDTAIAQTEKLIEAKRKLKKGLMQQLLTGKRRFPGFTGKLQRYEFSQIAKLSQARHDPKTSKQDFRCVELEHIAQGDGHLLGTTSSKKQSSVKALFDKRDILFGKLVPICGSTFFVHSTVFVQQKFGS